MFTLIDEDTLVKVVRLLGEEALQVVTILKEVDEISTNEIASLTNIQLNTVRKILYQLYEHSLITLRRTRDKDTGWFIFHWKLQSDQLEGFILNEKRRALEKLDARLEYENNHEFYYCQSSECRRIPFEEAMELLFKCPDCGKPLMHFDNKHIIEVLTQKIQQLRTEMSE